MEPAVNAAKSRTPATASLPQPSITVSGIRIAWNLASGSCTFEGLPVAMLWTDTTLAGLMAGVRNMVGTERFALALQSEGRNSVKADWAIISQFSSFEDGFRAIANIAAVAGWGLWEVESVDRSRCHCTIRVHNSWEAHYQRALGVSWGCGMLAGKMAGYCTRLFGVNCWADQTAFAANGDAFDAFEVRPSPKTIERELALLLQSDHATKADMAVALKKLQQEIEARTAAEHLLKENQQLLERRVAERTRELAASEAKFRTIIESLPMGVHLYELTDTGDLVFRGTNPAADAMLGIANTQFIGKTIEEAFPALIGTEVPQRYKDICSHNQVWRSESLAYEDAKVSGTFEVYAFQTSPGKMAVLFLDISEKLQKQELIRRQEQSIQQMQNLERLGVLAGGIAHDFNNILTAIIGNLSMLNESMPPDSEAADLVKGADKAAWRAQDLTQQLLTFAKGGAPIRQASSMATVIRDSADFLLRGSAIRVDYAFPDDLWLVDIDTGQMSQVIQNLIVNAKRAMPEGGTIKVTAENLAAIREKSIPLPSDRGFIRIAVADQGMGIPESIRDKVFEPYFTTKQEGSGLGLAIAFSILKRHEGYICFDSEVGVGTTFHIYLPRSGVQEVTAPVRAQVTHGRRLSVLVVDDEESVRSLYAAIGRRLGHRMTIVTSGEEALGLYRMQHGAIDLVVMDLTIPGCMGGKDAATRLLEINPQAKIVVSSGYSNDPTMSAYRQFGFCAMLPKPFRLEDFVALLNQVFQGDQSGAPH